jgi:adenine/guanine phosphoribosyltransferase-like PRPP-binding protein
MPAPIRRADGRSSTQEAGSIGQPRRGQAGWREPRTVPGARRLSWPDRPHRSGRSAPDCRYDRAAPGTSRRSRCQFLQLMPVEWWCPFLMPAAASSNDFWQDFLRADDPVLAAPSYQAGYPARLADGRNLLLPIRELPGDRTRAVASLITNQASFRVLDAIADVLTALVAQLGTEVVIGVPTLGLPLAEGVARRLGHPRMVALSTSRKFWYDEGLSEPLSSITSPQQSKRVYLDPRSLTLLADRRILLVDDVLSTGRSLSAVLRLLVKAGRPPTAIGVAMTQTQAWRAVLGRIDSRWPAVVRSAMSTPLLVPHEDGGWRPEAVTAGRGMDA